MTHEISTRSLLQQLATGDASDELSIESVLDSFRHRSYGLFLFFLLLPVFVPVPAGQGAFSGILIALIGIQMLLNFEHPWLPPRIANKTFKRKLIISFVKRFDTILRYIEKLCKPRWEGLFDHPFSMRLNGLLLCVLGICLALPYPLTNIPFGLVILTFCLAFIERDGKLLTIGWALAFTEVIFVCLTTGTLITLIETAIKHYF